MKVVEEELIRLRDNVIAMYSNAPKKGLFSFSKKQSSSNTAQIIETLILIRSYFSGNIFSANSMSKDEIIASLLTGKNKQKLVEIFYTMTAQANPQSKEELVELQKVLGIRTNVLNFKGKK
ncbi:hypothetical protein [[Limnothrix rosea] IAM M-220]|uniref:hypothetical protein n=1 Tax=[Limnothrix rosea] IAM M-220 TaxID=454133 RepID=UPI00095A651F|nr:hypothetical protein [[Limnothrix rosea] IAM M-220]OKH11740.1 hypothetical protein NIES208_16960 [[Limnothrix rosea] IAM M-220]